MRWATLLAAVLAAGCGSVPNKKEETPPPKKEEPSDLPTSLNVGKGNVVIKDLANKEPQWKMEWESAKVKVGDLSEEGGTATAQGVSGDIMRDGEVVSHYRAETGVGDRSAQRLTLSGSVEVNSSVYQARLFCKELVYDAKLKLIKARGGVKVTGDSGTIQTTELWATPNLEVVGTPELFNKK